MADEVPYKCDRLGRLGRGDGSGEVRGLTKANPGGSGMSVVKVITDSSAGLPQELARKFNISVVPISIQFGSETFRDGVDLDTRTFYAKLRGDVLPKTSQPSPGEFARVYKEALREFSSIVSVHVTAKASGTVQSARLASDMFPEADITVVDSGLTSMGLGFLALAGARVAKLGRKRSEVLRAIEEARERIAVYVALPSLEFLRKSGKVGAGQALLASLLSINPILTMKDGLLQVAERARTFPRALGRILELVEGRVGRRPVRLAVLHADALTQAKEYCARVVRALNCVEAHVVEIGPALAVHAGAGLLGMAVEVVE